MEEMLKDKKVLALYDFASKQEYIYRTSKIKEISGASALLAGAYDEFIHLLEKKGIKIRDVNKENPDTNLPKGYFESDNWLKDSDGTVYSGEVIYNGGGNLMVLFDSKETYIKANEIISVYLLKNAPGLNLIVSCVDCTGVFDGDRTRLFEENTRRKNQFPAYDMPAVMPFTQIDTNTFLPVTYKRSKGDKSSVYPASECSLSSDRYYKAKMCKETVENIEEMLAVLYIDGNSMGKKLIKLKSPDYSEGTNNLRKFSKELNEIYVDIPIKAIEEAGYKFRKVIAGGDEITLICKACEVFEIMKLYFECIKDKRLTSINDEKCNLCSSCAGISVCHPKFPFNVAYEIAEAACEHAKEKAHEEEGNYFSFYYCHSGVTNTFDVLHKREQEHTSGKPYSYADDLGEFEKYKELLNAAGRSNVKSLLMAAESSFEKYRFEVERINAYLSSKNKEDSDKNEKSESLQFEGTEKERKIVYDMAEFFDLWFAKNDKDTVGGEESNNEDDA